LAHLKNKSTEVARPASAQTPGARPASGPASVRRWDEVVGRLRPAGDGVPLAAVTLDALRPPRNVFCVGKNYRTG
jgi:hypothetical protein